MTTILQYLNIKSRLAEDWIKSMICPVLLMLMYVCAARECEFGLHLYPFKEMIPYFFAAGHCNYAINSIVYLRKMKNYQIPCLTKSWMMNMWSISRMGSSTESGVTWWSILLTWILEKVFNKFYKFCVFYANIIIIIIIVIIIIIWVGIYW